MKNMSDSQALIADFAAFCDEMADSKLILAERKIGNILRTIAASSILFELFSGVMENFDFALEFSKCAIPNSFGRVSLRFPSDRRKQVALVFTLLVEFDSKRRDLLAFLKENYTTIEDIGEAYRIFCGSAVLMFKQNVLSLLGLRVLDEVPKQFYLEAEEEPSTTSELENVIMSVLDSVRDVIDEVSKNAKLPVHDREDILILCEGVSCAASNRNSKAIKVALIGLVNTIRLKKLSDSKVREVCRAVDNFLELLD